MCEVVAAASAAAAASSSLVLHSATGCPSVSINPNKHQVRSSVRLALPILDSRRRRVSHFGRQQLLFNSFSSVSLSSLHTPTLSHTSRSVRVRVATALTSTILARLSAPMSLNHVTNNCPQILPHYSDSKSSSQTAFCSCLSFLSPTRIHRHQQQIPSPRDTPLQLPLIELFKYLLQTFSNTL